MWQIGQGHTSTGQQIVRPLQYFEKLKPLRQHLKALILGAHTTLLKTIKIYLIMLHHTQILFLSRGRVRYRLSTRQALQSPLL
jgi:hypothetical protein